jgi:hypothetical protein
LRIAAKAIEHPKKRAIVQETVFVFTDEFSLLTQS